MCLYWHLKISLLYFVVAFTPTTAVLVTTARSSREGSHHSRASKDPHELTPPQCIRATVVMRPTATANVVSRLMSTSTPRYTLCHSIPMLGKTSRMIAKTGNSNQASPPIPGTLVGQPTGLPALPTRVPTLELLDARRNASLMSPRRGEKWGQVRQ
jgi:hypothetical protein